MYLWRKLKDEQRHELLAWRRKYRRPWHGPPHWHNSGHAHAWMFTAACYEHAPHIGYSAGRIAAFEETILATVREHSSGVTAWAVLPNHYHILATTTSARGMLTALGRLHGRLSKEWNAEEGRRGRQVWCRAAETAMKTTRHLWATVNYIHHNPVKHGYVTRWQDWPFGSAPEYVAGMDRDELIGIWREYPIDDYGSGWDD